MSLYDEQQPQAAVAVRDFYIIQQEGCTVGHLRMESMHDRPIYPDLANEIWLGGNTGLAATPEEAIRLLHEITCENGENICHVEYYKANQYQCTIMEEELDRMPTLRDDHTLVAGDVVPLRTHEVYRYAPQQKCVQVRRQGAAAFGFEEIGEWTDLPPEVIEYDNWRDEEWTPPVDGCVLHYMSLSDYERIT